MKTTKPLSGIFFTLVVALQAHAQDPFTNGLVAYYPFNGNANDESGNGFNASISGAVLTADRLGVTNSAFYFNGAGGRISAAVSTIPLGNSPRTISAWIRPDTDTHPVNAIIVHGSGDCTGLMFGISYSKYLGGTPGYDNIGFWGGCQDYLSGLIVRSNQWSFVAVTYDGLNMRIYANGLSEGNAIGTLNTQSSLLWIGAETLNNGSSFRDFFKGSIDQVRVYNRALSSNEVAQVSAFEAPPYLNLRKAVYVDAANLRINTNYQLQVSADLNIWTNYGATFNATNSTLRFTNYWDVDNWDSLFFRLKVSP